MPCCRAGEVKASRKRKREDSEDEDKEEEEGGEFDYVTVQVARRALARIRLFEQIEAIVNAPDLADRLLKIPKR